MRPEWRLASSSRSGRPWRTALLLGTVVIATTLSVMVACGAKSAQGAVSSRLADSIGKATARVIHPGGGRIERSVLETVRSWPGVETAVGRMDGSLTLERADGAKDPKTQSKRRVVVTAEGIEIPDEYKVRTLRVAQGVLPSGPNEVLLDKLAARKLDAGIGTELLVRRFGKPIPLKVTGIWDRPIVGPLQNPTAFVEIGVLGEAVNRRDGLGTIAIVHEEGIDVPAFVEARGAEVPEFLALEAADLVKSGFDRRVRGGELATLVISVMTFLGAGFIIVTGLTTGVSERQRELAVLRSVGASRGQVFRSQLFIGLWLGILGGLLGIPIGLALTRVVAEIYSEKLPDGMLIDWLGIGRSFLGATTAGVFGAVYPAWLASRTSPLDGISNLARSNSKRDIQGVTIVGFLLLAVAWVTAFVERGETRYWYYIYVGLPCLLLAAFALSVPLLTIFAGFFGRPVARLLGLPGDVIRGTILTTPFRHGMTAGALMLGLAILTASWAVGVAVRHDWIDRIKFADGFAIDPAGFNQEDLDAVRKLDFITDTCELNRLPVEITDQQVFGIEGIYSKNAMGIGFDPEIFFSLNAIDWVEGSLVEALPALQKGDGVLVADRFQTAKGYRVGDSITLKVGRAEKVFSIVGIVSSAGLDLATQMFGVRDLYSEFAVSTVFIDRQVVGDIFGNQEVHLLQANLVENISDQEAELRIAEAAPGVVFRSGRWILDTIDDISRTSMGIMTSVAFGALILATLATGSVVAANLRGRAFEYGVMRSVGASRSAVARIIFGEAIILSMTAIVMGVTLGMHFANFDRMHYAGLVGIELRPRPVAGPTTLGAVTTFAMCMLASLIPLRRLLDQPPAVLVAAGRNE